MFAVVRNRCTPTFAKYLYSLSTCPFSRSRCILQYNFDSDPHQYDRSFEREHKDESSKLVAETLNYPDGSIYVGETMNGLKKGFGKLTYPNGDTLEGKFNANSIFTGKGVWLMSNGIAFKGKWVDGLMEGHGKYIHKCGKEQEGFFSKGELLLHNVLLTLDGIIYKGTLVSGKINGPGSMVTPSGITYTGGFVNGKYDGSGTLCHPKKGKYVGEWKNGARCGMGFQTYKTGGTYKGEWKENMKDGQGKWESAAGHTMEGEFREDRLYNGKGCKNGVITVFRDGVAVLD
jgi:hypothetical protein